MPPMDIAAETERVWKFVQRGNYHAALNIALSGLNECRRGDDQAGVDSFLSLIEGVVTTLEQVYGSQAYLDRQADG